MSEEIIEYYKDLDEINKERKTKRNTRNRSIIAKWIVNTTFEMVNLKIKEAVILFRCPSLPSADFYPTTNKWRSDNKNYYGDATKFLTWLESLEDGK